ncbi:molecular chaperone DnaJ [Alcanivorax profundi]|uniref:Molecular chaperone DnaJ n=1 Tax=Alcanivorax profundi TaxID=2338368 RepID=A0A418XZF9_9GAMM|nr:molecular chaperone DnaJ [Alcanivorax profundi]RJG18393.1 molecular chaperone DnaJ [Alcanivorax profundi]
MYKKRRKADQIPARSPLQFGRCAWRYAYEGTDEENICSGICGFAFGCGVASPVKEELGYEGQNSDGLAVSELLETMKSNPDVQVRVDRGWQIAEVKSERALYSFTPETHPAHPSYVKRQIIQKEGSIFIETSARCGAEKNVCDQLVRRFVELNNKVKNSIGAK